MRIEKLVTCGASLGKSSTSLKITGCTKLRSPLIIAVNCITAVILDSVRIVTSPILEDC